MGKKGLGEINHRSNEIAYLHYGLGEMKQSTGRICTNRLIGQQCGQQKEPYLCDGCRPPGCDHASMWNRDGKPYAFIFQPYMLTMEKLEELTEFCRQRGLEFYVSGKSWHAPGDSLLVVIRKRLLSPDRASLENLGKTF